MNNPSNQNCVNPSSVPLLPDQQPPQKQKAKRYRLLCRAFFFFKKKNLLIEIKNGELMIEKEREKEWVILKKKNFASAFANSFSFFHQVEKARADTTYLIPDIRYCTHSSGVMEKHHHLQHQVPLFFLFSTPFIIFLLSLFMLCRNTRKSRTSTWISDPTSLTLPLSLPPLLLGYSLSFFLFFPFPPAFNFLNAPSNPGTAHVGRHRRSRLQVFPMA